MSESKTLILKKYCDEGHPTNEHFDVITSTVHIDQIADDDVVIQVLAMSADPYLRGHVKSPVAAKVVPGTIGLGQPMNGFIAGKIVASKNPDWVVGDLIGAALPFTTLQVVPKAVLSKTVSWKLTGLIEEADISLGIGILGMPGSTAYGGLDVLKPKKGETIFISAAAGIVGGLVGMLMKQVYDCKVIGSCGGPDKCALIKEKFGFDHAIDYKLYNSEEELTAALKEVAPDGIDMYFENVGGYHFETAFNSLKNGGRICVCGQIAEYNSLVPNLNKINPMKMIYSQQRIEGLICFGYLAGAKGTFLKDMHAWLKEGKVVKQETIFQGIESWPEAFQSLFTGGNIGKVVVRI